MGNNSKPNPRAHAPELLAKPVHLRFLEIRYYLQYIILYPYIWFVCAKLRPVGYTVRSVGVGKPTFTLDGMESWENVFVRLKSRPSAVTSLYLKLKHSYPFVLYVQWLPCTCAKWHESRPRMPGPKGTGYTLYAIHVYVIRYMLHLEWPDGHEAPVDLVTLTRRTRGDSSRIWCFEVLGAIISFSNIVWYISMLFLSLRAWNTTGRWPTLRRKLPRNDTCSGFHGLGKRNLDKPFQRPTKMDWPWGLITQRMRCIKVNSVFLITWL